MNQPLASFHHTHLSRLHRRLKRMASLQKKNESRLRILFNCRLITGVTTLILALVVASGPQYRYWGILFLMDLFSFFFFVVLSIKAKRWQRSLFTWERHCNRMISRLQGKMPLPDQKIYVEVHQQKSFSESAILEELSLTKQTEKKILAQNLHLIGENSLFGLMDETFSNGGRKALTHLLLSPLLSCEEIISRQEQLQSLKKNKWPLTRFFLTGQKGDFPPDSSFLKKSLQNTLVSPQFPIYLKLHFILFPMTLIIEIMWLLGEVNRLGPIFFSIYVLYSLTTLSHAAKSFTQGEALSLHLESLLPVFSWLENAQHLSSRLAPTIYHLKPTRRLHQVRRYLSFLSIQAHPLVFFIVNAVVPWTYIWTWKLEQWRKKYFLDFVKSLEEVEFLEALGSMALFHYYQSPYFPSISKEPQLRVKKIFHPLIARDKVVANDFTMTAQTHLTLITGSNMSGKSTFLRTLGMNQHLSMIGAPVFAESFHTFLAPVLTCLQIRDSLEEGYSSFYYEVKRVKIIIDCAKSGQSLFFLIDEIFRGTNNRERLWGSQAVIEELLRSTSAIGLISTHDLELTQLANDFPSLANGHFRDEIRKDHSALEFSYRYHLGPCPTTNALKIMAAEGLPVLASLELE